MVEIPLADSLADAEECLEAQRASGLVGMVGHTRRFNPSHQWVHNAITAGDFAIQQMDVQTFFFRRKNLNALGQPRSWTDHLLWHHAAHTVDLFAYQCGSPVVKANAVQGPIVCARCLISAPSTPGCSAAPRHPARETPP